jgi:hypothetical protein
MFLSHIIFVTFAARYCYQLQPVELASANEKASMLKKKNETKRFFEDMEANIINKVCLSDCLSA